MAFRSKFDITFTSNCAVAGNIMPILKCNFTHSQILAPFVARVSNQSYDLKFKCNWSRTDKRHVTFTHTGLIDEENGNGYDNGTICIGMEFLRYKRYLE